MANWTFNRQQAFGLLDLMATLAIMSLLTAVAVPAYTGYAERARVSAAIGDVQALSLSIEKFRLNNEDRLPASLAELSMDVPLDPWQQQYQYLNVQDAKNKGAVRKDGKLNPLNSDFDLFSLGADGDSKGPLNAKASRDDIVRANNGAYIGLGEDY